MTEPTQADRDAAAAYWKVSRIGNAETQRRYLSGEADASFIVQAFAAHRIASTAALQEQLTQTQAKAEKLAEALRSCRRATLHNAPEPRHNVREIVDQALTEWSTK